MRPGAFVRELELDRLEARAGTQVAEYLEARWRLRARDPEGAPPLPAVFGDAALERRLAGWRAESRRAEMLWRWCALACVEGSAEVRVALRDGCGGDVLAARNRAARGLGWASYWELGLARAELDEHSWSAPWHAAASEAPPSLAAELAAEPRPERAAERILDALGAWGAPLVGVALDVLLVPDIDAPVRARTYPVRPPHDVRVYVRGPHAPRGWRALAHELGHAVYARSHSADAPWSLRAAPSRVLDEAVAFWAEHAVVGADEAAIAAQRARVEAERRAYRVEGAADVPTWMIADPVAQPAYLEAMRVAGQLWQRATELEPQQPALWLFEQVLRGGAERSTREVLERAGLAPAGSPR